MRTCEDFGVTIKTFQHILEGYKVAETMAKHGAGGSSFSDWWAYKMEVVDAIPYNGALMHNAGIVVSFNSDSNEMGRRLNTEAAKAVKYGGVPEEEALKFVTLNPAIQLGVQNRVGSVEVGKDADLVMWSSSPLSTLSICEITWVDGRRYFDREDDAVRRAELMTMRAALIQKILNSGEEGEGGGDKKKMWPRHDVYCGFHHDDEKE
jgi:N-acetylglucosamine-6-phosphate deacetylase